MSKYDTLSAARGIQMISGGEKDEEHAIRDKGVVGHFGK